ncbi:hypothetical protein ACVMB0_005229 [Bradyrhizobium sp. USDA 4451]
MRATEAPKDGAAFCADLVRTHDFVRYASTLFLAGPERRALLALYAFNIEVSRVHEQVSQPLPGEMRLQWWTDMLAGAGHGGVEGNPVAAELLQAIRTHRLPVSPLSKLVEEHQFDLYNDPMPSLAALEGYLDATAAALFSQATRVVARPSEAIDHLVRHAGLAQGMAQVIASLGRDASRQQLFLPLELLPAARQQQGGGVCGQADAGHSRCGRPIRGRGEGPSQDRIRAACRRAVRRTSDLPAARLCQARAEPGEGARQRSVPAAAGLTPAHAVDVVAGCAHRRVRQLAALLRNMLGEDPDRRAPEGRAAVVDVRCDLLDRVAQRNELRLPRHACGSTRAGQLVHRGVADLAFDFLIAVHHGEAERQAFGIISPDTATGEWHQTCPLRALALQQWGFAPRLSRAVRRELRAP